jgi:phenylacetate-CoA ligase
VLGNARTSLIFGAISLRNQGWHRRDLSLKLCTIKDLERPTDPQKAATFDYPHGISADNWTGHIGSLFNTGPAAALHIHTPVDLQAEWLKRHDPGHLMTFPSNLAALLQHCRTAGITYPRLRSIWTLGEIVTPELRELAHVVLGLPITDVYSSVEVGYIALQCPDQPPHYHAQSEGVLVEVIDQQGQPCKPGEVGRVIVTPLHNFAMPLLRYAIGDYAEVGGPCRCGRGLPVLTKVLGRTRNMLILPSGQRIWPLLEGALFSEVAPVSQFQVVQLSHSLLEVRLVTTRPVTPAEEDALGAMIRRHLEHPFTIAFTYPESIPRGPGGKYEDFICKIGA